MRVYISGPITGHPEYLQEFQKAQKRLERLGYTAINPAAFNDVLPELSYEEYMKMDFALLELCEAIYMLDGWQKSCGSNREYGYALARGMKVIVDEQKTEKEENRSGKKDAAKGVTNHQDNQSVIGKEKDMQEKRVESVTQIDFRGMKMPIIAVYENPKDFPGMIVARVFEMNYPTDTIMVKSSLTEMQQDISKIGMIFLPRTKQDDPKLIGTWI